MTDKQTVASEQSNEARIFLVRGQRVMLGAHLAAVYGVEPQALDQAIERNIERFPEDSVFRLNHEEIADLEALLALPIQAIPYALTGQGVAILSSALFDERTLYESHASCAPTCSCRK